MKCESIIYSCVQEHKMKKLSGAYLQSSLNRLKSLRDAQVFRFGNVLVVFQN